MVANSVYFQGAFGAFSHQAAKLFAESINPAPTLVPCQSFAEVFKNVLADGTSYGAIPLENSTIGSIVSNYDLLWDSPAQITAELALPVHHQLIGLAGTSLSEIVEVYSHPAALDQCRVLFRDYPNMAPRVHWDTSGAVVFVKESGNKKFAAIASSMAATEYDMMILLPDIEDFPKNATRFALIKAAKAPVAPAKPIKMTCALELPHKAGVLAGLLSSVGEMGVNLTKIESRPIGEMPWHYRFFIDLELERLEDESRVADLIRAATDSHRLLGVYTAGL